MILGSTSKTILYSFVLGSLLSSTCASLKSESIFPKSAFAIIPAYMLSRTVSAFLKQKRHDLQQQMLEAEDNIKKVLESGNKEQQNHSINELVQFNLLLQKIKNKKERFESVEYLSLFINMVMGLVATAYTADQVEEIITGGKCRPESKEMTIAILAMWGTVVLGLSNMFIDIFSGPSDLQ